MTRNINIWLLLLPLLSMGHSLHQEKEEVQIKSTYVAGNIYMLEGSGGNIGISVGEDGILVVDDQFDWLSDKIKAAIAKINPGKIKYVLNTHHHGDHTGGNKNFGKQATIIAHHNVHKRLSADSSKSKHEFPVITFEEGLSVHFNSEEIKAIHLHKGHTDGDAAVYFTKSNVIHMGDQFFNGGLPYIDLNSGGSAEGYLNNLKVVMNIINDSTKIIPGHGSLTDMQGLKYLYKMLYENIEYVKGLIKEGKSLKQIQEKGVLQPYKNRASQWMTEEVWLEILYNSLNKKNPG